jgi:hypothetical protein
MLSSFILWNYVQCSPDIINLYQLQDDQKKEPDWINSNKYNIPIFWYPHEAADSKTVLS